ncbi:hypothetical protein ACFFV7_04515 [Nonomuraea spiralis]|uniref:Uncharacterized protein n=1 Tax=Nonomuraea spiralis TaxID=46182 RepID=A0ABV5I8L5_9ACTN|nr:hypothetical protein [Nonomuraea spiralis]GGT10168.1 hypothetical protein GCM10010176_063410 [Nonomuraea spiralis]
MSSRLQMAFAILAGYYLGRRHKLRTAAALAAAGLAGRASCGQGGLLAQGVKALGSSPELQRMTGRLRGELMEVGKAAAISAATKQIDSLTQKLQEHGAKPGAPQDEEAEARPTKRQAPKDEETDYGDEDYDEHDRYKEDDYEEEPEVPEQARRRPEGHEGHRGQRRTRPVRRVGQSRR